MTDNHPCFHFNHEPFPNRVEVQDGYETLNAMLSSEFVRGIRVHRIVKIPNPMSKDCKQWDKETGEAVRLGWNCAGCRWAPEQQERGG
jgi:hypothetical protein